MERLTEEAVGTTEQANEVCCAAPRLDDLRAVLEDGEHWLILTHDNPDPDALASAFALLKLAESFDHSTARIGFGGFVGRAENSTMVRELGLPISPTWAVSFDDVDRIALVDTIMGERTPVCSKLHCSATATTLKPPHTRR